MNELHLFAGAGGGILAGQLLGHRCIAAVEWEPYAQAVLVARQNDGTFPPFPIWDDVQTFDGRPYRGIADVVAGGFPCQDISVAGGGVQDLTENAAECGTTWPASLAKYDPATHTLKTPQLSLIEDLTGCSVTLPRSGLMRNGECWERPMLEPTTNANESGFSPEPEVWPTPTASDHSNRQPPENYHTAKSGLIKHVAPNGEKSAVRLSQIVNFRAWPTPQARDYRSGDAPDSPRAVRKREAGWSPNLNDVVIWPTPNAMLAASDLNFQCSGDGREKPNKLGWAVAQKMGLDKTPTMWPTATATAYKGWSPNHNRAATDDRLDYSVECQGFQPGQQTPPMRLNPNWVEWLMGWPIGQTALKPLAMAKFREWQQQHSFY